MSLTIRLSRIGRKNQPAYKLVVSNTRDKRNGKFVDILGHFNPLQPENKFSYDKEKYEKWVKSGALVTEAVKKLMENKYEYVKYDPKKIKEEKENAKKMAEEAAKEVKSENKTEEVKHGTEEPEEKPAKEVKPEAEDENIENDGETPAEESVEEPAKEVQEESKGE